jgi:enoyl-[acyl-carrier protein] reductase II
MIKTVLSELLGIRYPLFQGGMAWISDAGLASAVSNAGGLGIIAAGNAPADYVRAQIRKTRLMTGKPFGVNLMLMSPTADEVAELLADENVSVIVTGAGNPAKYMERWRSRGIKVIPVVASTALAKMMERAGASAVVAEGGESGGHVGDLSTMALVPQVCDAVKIPVIAAGGIGDGRGIAAALMLGACGVQVGTRFLVAEECSVHPNYKNMVLKAKDIDTMTVGKRLGHPARQLKNPFAREFLAKEQNNEISNDEIESFIAGSLRLAAVEGDVRGGAFMAGQISGMIKQEQTAREIIEEMFGQAEEILSGAARWVIA